MKLLPKCESLTVEFKSDCKGYPDKGLVEACVAMVNTQGDTPYLGVEDDGEVTGITEKPKDEIGVCAMIMNKVVPSVFLKAEKIQMEQKYVLAIYIPKSHSIVASIQGKILRRRLKVMDNLKMFQCIHMKYHPDYQI